MWNNNPTACTIHDVHGTTVTPKTLQHQQPQPRQKQESKLKPSSPPPQNFPGNPSFLLYMRQRGACKYYNPHTHTVVTKENNAIHMSIFIIHHIIVTRYIHIHIYHHIYYIYIYNVSWPTRSWHVYIICVMYNRSRELTKIMYCRPRRFLRTLLLLPE